MVYRRDAESAEVFYKKMWLSGNLQLNTSDSYLTTKNTKAE
jgi:hypothetical protein